MWWDLWWLHRHHHIGLWEIGRAHGLYGPPSSLCALSRDSVPLCGHVLTTSTLVTCSLACGWGTHSYVFRHLEPQPSSCEKHCQTCWVAFACEYFPTQFK